MRAIVIGGGIGGLAAAVALVRAGHEVTVYERAPGSPEVGAGISLWGNALRALEHLEVWPGIRDAATMQIAGARRPDGRWLARTSGKPAPFEVLLVHRAQLHEHLAAALAPGVLVTDRTVGRVGRDGTVTTVAGTEQADLVVAADGLHSGVRSALWPEHPDVRYAGFTAWRGVTAEPFPLDEASGTFGRGSELGLTLLRDGRVYWYVTANRPEGERAADEHAEVLGRFGGWHRPVREVVEATEPGAVLRHDIYHLPTPLPSFARGRVVLLGDAAHAMTPNLGQGACQALEDAVTLGVLLTGGGQSWETALRRYDELRRPRAERFVKASLRAARALQTENRLAVAARTAATRLVPPSVAGRPVRRLVEWSPPQPG